MNIQDRDLVNTRQISLICTGTNWTTIVALGVIYKTLNGSYRLRFNITGSLSSTSSSIELTVEGISFKRYNNGQAIAAWAQDGSGVTNHAEVGSAGNFITVNLAAVTSTFMMSGDVELVSKPGFME